MKVLEQFRIRRGEIFDGLFSARALCITGLMAMPAFLFNPSVPLRVVQFLFFWFLCWLSGKKNRAFITLFVISLIVFVNLLLPYGKILFEFGIFKVSSGALKTGIGRAVTLSGLIMLSRLSIRQDLKFPFFFGELLSDSFRYFSVIVNSKKNITGKNFIGDIDRLMLDLSNLEMDKLDEAGITVKTRLEGFVILSVVLLLTWLLWFAHYCIIV